MLISILGSLEILGPRGPVRLTAPRQKIVLATLLWNANRMVPIERLIDSVWNGTPPLTARSQVHICVSNVRKRLARGGLHSLVNTEPPGYSASVGPDQLDLHIFDQLVATGRALVAQGRLDAAADKYAAALELWRGQPFQGLDSDRVRSAAAQISERQIAVLEEYFDLQLELGHPAAIISELIAQIEEHPFREHLRAQKIVALCRTGRQVEALREFRETRTLFAEELGLEPGVELRRLEREILTGSCV